MNGLSLLALIAVVVGVIVAYRLGRMHGRVDGSPPAVPWSTDPRREAAAAASMPPSDVPTEVAAVESPVAGVAAAPVEATIRQPDGAIEQEKYRLIVAYEAESTRLRDRLVGAGAETAQLRQMAEDRRRLYRELAVARADTARYRQLVVDLENNAPPPILGERGAPDDLKLIVGIGPVLERMLQQLGIATYRQIARWTEHDIDEMDARLPEFPGRIRRDAWVTQARELHQSKYGARPT